MRLDKIKLAGFKSFVDPTTILFPSNLAGVVGPNGCGKSNVIDAVRWVMGESSAGKLRGESMADVIFNGSSGRKPVGQASVELVFDNSDGRVGGEYAGYAQLAIRREVNRDAQSTYFLNGTRCRRKDITRIFLGTGLGPRSYSVIEQGMISRFIDAKPDELRVYLEEVAGISRYKDRRHETETRIRHTRENLARLSDLRGELEKQLATLNRQAIAATRYKELKVEEQQLKAELTALHYADIKKSLAHFELALQEQETLLENKRALLRRVEAEIETHRDSQLELSDRFNEVQQRFYSLGNDVTRLEQVIAHQKERLQQLSQDHLQLEQEYTALTTHLQEDETRRDSLESALVTLRPVLENASTQSELSQERLEAVEEALADWQLRFDDFNQASSSTLRLTEVEKTKISHLQSQYQQTQGRLVQLHQEQSTLHIEELPAAIDVLKREELATATLLAQLEEELAAQQDFLKEERAREVRLQQQVQSLRHTQQEKSGRLMSLKALQEAALGETHASVTTWLTHHMPAKTQRLAQTLKVEAGWEKAVETVLGAYLEAVCVDHLADYQGTLSTLTEGALILFASQDAGVVNAQKLLSKITTSTKLGAILNTVYIAEDVATAFDKLAELASHESVVTREGVWLSKSWIRINKVTDVKSGILVREKEIDTLTQELDVLAQTLAEQSHAHQTSQQDLLSLQTQIDHVQRQVNQTMAQHAQQQASLRVKQEQLTQMQQRLLQLKHDVEELSARAEELQTNLITAQNTLAQAEESTQEHEQVRATLLTEREHLKASLDTVKAQARADEHQWHEHNSQVQTTQSQLETMKLNIERLAKQLIILSSKREQLSLALESQNNPDVDLEGQLKQKLDERLQAEEVMRTAKRSLESVDEILRRADAERHEIEEAISTVRDQAERVRLDSQGLRVRAETLIEALTAMSLTLENVQAQLVPEATVALWQERLEQTENRITRLGAINLVAIDEFKLQSERKTYLDSQNDDLVKALDILESAIRKIDQETQEKFKETFDQVNHNLQELFPKVFGGGEAYLELTGDNLLETGITIMARPPGKKNSSIHLLSGGEKALTAISLVFSIFQINPAPFCLLDEVDAPLDDSNVLRYCHLVKEMSQKLQFIFITHNKVAMEMAEHLMGVTMHEPGVSRIVSVDVNQAVEMAVVD